MNYQALLTALKAATTYREMQSALKKARVEFGLDIPCKLNAKKEKLVAAIAILVKFCDLKATPDADTDADTDAEFHASVKIKEVISDAEEEWFVNSMRHHFGDRCFVA